MARLQDEFNQVFGEVAVFVIEEGGGETQVTHTTRTTDAMNVLLDVGGQVEVDDVLDVRDVETTSGNLKKYVNVEIT